MNVNQEFAQMLNSILVRGSDVDTRNSKTKRLRNMITTFYETPLVSVRRTAWKNSIREMEWFLSGSNNINDLHPNVRKWWEPWADGAGSIPNNYSEQFRRFVGVSHWGLVDSIETTDQIEYLVSTLRDHPMSRRNVATTWNTTDMLHPNTPITNCHGTMIQMFVEPSDNSVHMTMYQRSCDMVLGVPHNWLQYWAFLQWLSHQCGRKVGSFTWIGGDCHIYESHFDLACEIIEAVKNNEITNPELVYKPNHEEFKHQDFSLNGSYNPFLKKSANMVV